MSYPRPYPVRLVNRMDDVRVTDRNCGPTSTNEQVAAVLMRIDEEHIRSQDAAAIHEAVYRLMQEPKETRP